MVFFKAQNTAFAAQKDAWTQQRPVRVGGTRLLEVSIVLVGAGRVGYHWSLFAVNSNDKCKG